MKLKYFILFLVFTSFIACGQNLKKENKMEKVTTKNKIIGLIGAGNVGGTLGRKWVTSGYKVIFSSRNPEELKSLVNELGPNASAESIEETAKKADIIVLAIPFKAEKEVSDKIKPYIEGKFLLNCDNAYPGRDGQVADEARKIGAGYYSQQNYFPQVKFIRAFSSTAISNVGMATKDNPVTIPYAADNEEEKQIAEELIKAADGNPKYIGSVKNSKSLDY